jgi:hydrogenase expression/formation protein HypC
MCIGAPLQVRLVDGTQAWCEADGQGEWLDMQLLGAQSVGSWVLAFHGTARQSLSAEEAQRMRAARLALAAAQAGQANLDAYFADLIERKPALPAHLQTGQTS